MYIEYQMRAAGAGASRLELRDLQYGRCQKLLVFLRVAEKELNRPVEELDRERVWDALQFVVLLRDRPHTALERQLIEAISQCLDNAHQPHNSESGVN